MDHALGVVTRLDVDNGYLEDFGHRCRSVNAQESIAEELVPGGTKEASEPAE
jgi:hypothetical protein